jgi:endo-1,4-beta-xylanase
VNYTNDRSFGGAASAAKFNTATRVIPGGYIVEGAIAIDAAPLAIGQFIGFDVQVNNDGAGDGVRTSVATWNDTTGNAYQNTSVFGTLRLSSAGVPAEN